MKKCKYCQSDIDEKARICPYCRRGQENVYLKVIGVIVALFLIIGIIITVKNGADDFDKIRNTGYAERIVDSIVL